jgi:hypothetical protein
MARFTAIPNVPQADVPYWQTQTLNAMKQNIELLTGIGGELDGASKAITKGNVTVSNTPTQTMTQVTARGTGFTISGQSVASLEDYGKLISNVQSLANDVATLRSYVNALITQLRG